ncbi:MAG: hypothetical protein WKF30_17035 [Pyrinomonadaceae bacterium]
MLEIKALKKTYASGIQVQGNPLNILKGCSGFRAERRGQDNLNENTGDSARSRFGRG